MGLYNFQQRFIPYVQDGSKTHTIRAIRRHPQKVGELMHLYYGLRTKWAKRIIDPAPCTAVKTIFILPEKSIYLVNEILTEADAKFYLEHEIVKLIFSDKADCLNIWEKDALAWNDGFRHEAEPLQKEGCFEIMFRWWNQTHELPFFGHINYWS